MDQRAPVTTPQRSKPAGRQDGRAGLSRCSPAAAYRLPWLEERTPDDVEMLVSDAEREAAASALRAALTDGTLTIDEAEQRLGAAYAARRRGQLDEVLADVPHTQPLPRDRPALSPPVTRAASLMLACVVGLIAVVALIAATTGGHVPWPVIPVGFFAVRALRRRTAGRTTALGRASRSH